MKPGNQIKVKEKSIFASGIPHPECLAIGPNRMIYCGSAYPKYTDAGYIYQISPDGKNISQFAHTGGRVLGLAFDSQGGLFACDGKQGSIFYINRLGKSELFASEVNGRKFLSPNFILFSSNGSMIVSDSGTAKANEKTGAIYRLFPDGKGELLVDGLIFPNGLALSKDEATLFVVLTRNNQVIKFPLNVANNAVEPSNFIDEIDDGPDGICLDQRGNVFIAVTRTNRIYCVAHESNKLTCLLEDPSGYYLNTPSNCLFYGEDNQTLLVTNLFGDYITQLTISTE